MTTNGSETVAFGVGIRNVGPVHRADLELSPLTVLVGPNNSGKSVAATVLHVVTGSSPASLRRSTRSARRGSVFPFRRRLSLETSNFAQVLRYLAGLESPEIRKGLPTEIARGLRSVVDGVFEVYGDQVVRQLEDAFGSELDEIVRSRQGRRMPARIEVTSRDPRWAVSISFARPKPRIEIVTRPSEVELAERMLRTEEFALVARYAMREERVEFMWTDVFEILGSILFDSFPEASFYLPAARSGILQSHRTLAAALVRSSTRAGIEEMAVPKVSGLVADFISEVLEMSPRRRESEFAAIADYLEEGILHGGVAVDLDTPYPEISYDADGLRLPLHRTSSMVSELAPVVLYLRYVLSEQDLLVIEEPESHLHPENQLLMARALTRLAASGAWIALTTHSDYLLQSFSNAIRASSSGQPALFKDLDDGRGLEVGRVGAYLFTPSSTDGGTDTVSIPVSPEYGISDEEFSRVAEVLYHETVTLDKAVLRDS